MAPTRIYYYKDILFSAKAKYSLLTTSFYFIENSAMCGQLLQKASVFQNCDVNLISVILPKPQHVVFQEDGIIIHQNTSAAHMFLTEQGEVIKEMDSVHEQLCNNDY